MRNPKSCTPTSHDIDALTAFLSKLYKDGPEPIVVWHDPFEESGAMGRPPWPEYREDVRAFFEMAGNDAWADYGYVPETAGRLLKETGAIESADLLSLKTMLTYCVRGERFCDGHWEMMVSAGYIRRILTRLAELRSEFKDGGRGLGCP